MAPTPSQRALTAIDAMKEIGVDTETTESALRKLLPEFNYNWELIEDENYRVLADFIFDKESSKAAQQVEDQDACIRKNKTDPGALSLLKSCDTESSKRTKHKNADDHRSRDDMEQNMHKKKKEAESSFKREEQHHPSSQNDSRTLTDSCRPNLGYLGSPVKMRMDRDACRNEKAVINSGRPEERCNSYSHNGSSHRSELVIKKPNIECAIKKSTQHVLTDQSRQTENSPRKKKVLGNVAPQHSPGDQMKQKRQIDPSDIANGQERVEIKLIHDTKWELPSFYYIPHNIIFRNAHVNTSLDRIGDENCCPNCSGDCLTAAIPCPCTRETGGEYAYTSEGLVREDFLESCISRNQDPKEDHIHYCKDCPLERIKNEVLPEQCKGHVIKRFIKECWSKCGCNKKCGNRVVQRGITCDLQVYHIDTRKGWGVRTANDLPMGTFICEYVGEILTNMELYDRTMNATCNDKHTYPVTLDADWACEQILEDEEALCLDATYYGNVARFVNHSCDPNLVAIPVEIETPDHHYYHLAFFTTRKIEAYEELCWDYGIEFDDDNHPIKAFTCLCGSKKCRDKNRLEAKTCSSAEGQTKS